MKIGPISVYGLLIACAAALGVFLCSKQEKRLGFPKDTGVDLALFALPGAVIGARAYYVLFSLDLFREDPWSVLYIWEGGLAIYGGVIGGVLGVLLMSRIRKLPFFRLTDMAVPALILGQAIGRWGNFFNGEAFGYEMTNPAWQFFPVCVFVGETWHLATFFYESMWDLTGFFLLYLNRKKVRRDGDLTACYFLWYGVGRAFIEGLRTDSLYLGPLRVSQVLSLVMVFAAGTWLLLSRRRELNHTEYDDIPNGENAIETEKRNE